MPAFDSLQKMSFDGIPFLVERATVKGGSEHHIHKYPHSPGGKVEKLGRKLYTITCEGVFAVGVKQYPNAWPDDLQALRLLFEQEATRDLVIPTVGTIQAFATDWDQEMSNRMRSGEKTHFTFLEDSDNALLVDKLLVNQAHGLAPLTDELLTFAAQAGYQPNIFDSIKDLAGQIESLKDQAELQAAIIAEKAGALADLCRAIDSTMSSLNDPAAWPVVAALHALGVAADQLNRDALSTGLTLGVFEVPYTMTISAVSRAIYGDTSHAVELMQLNPFENVFAIPAKFGVRYYPHAA